MTRARDERNGDDLAEAQALASDALALALRPPATRINPGPETPKTKADVDHCAE